MTTTTDHSTTYRVVSPLIRDHADNPAIDFDRDEAVTRDELDAPDPQRQRTARLPPEHRPDRLRRRRVAVGRR